MQSTLSFERSKISDPYNKIPVINNKDGDEGEVVVAIETENQNLVFFFQYCSDLLWEKKCSSDGEKIIKICGWEFAKLLRSLEQFIPTVYNFWNRMLLELFSGCFRSNTLEQFKFKLEKIIGISNL